MSAHPVARAPLRPHNSVAAILGLFVLACTTVACSAAETLRLVTTTTTDNSGLIARLVPEFEAASGYAVQVIAVGTGRALELLANGDVDVALTHARARELALVEAGEAIAHHPVMYNDFVLVGPHNDPAGAGGTADITAALAAIAGHRQPFLSRGDDSGTHVRERALWRALGQAPQGAWYRETGQGMGRTLQMAVELEAYTLTDRGTWLAYRARLPGLALLFQGSAQLFNQYAVMSANPALYPDTNAAGAAAFTRWILSPMAKNLIRAFTIDGQSLFVPLL